MIAPPGGARLLVATRPVDFRKAAKGLTALVKDQMRLEPFSGIVFVFRAKRADRIKLLWWDGTGVFLLAKRLADGRFQWPKIQDGTLRLSAALLEGLDWRRVHQSRRARVPLAAN